MAKSPFVVILAEKSGLKRKQTASKLDAINAKVAQQLGKQGPGEVLLPGLRRLNVVNKPAPREHEGVNPFTKEPMTYKTKAARKVIRVRPLKALKDAGKASWSIHRSLFSLGLQFICGLGLS